jgi:hypothetical protein
LQFLIHDTNLTAFFLDAKIKYWLQDYILPDVKDRQFLITFYKKAKKDGFDVQQYNELRDSIYSIERDLVRLRDPLNLHLPPNRKTAPVTEKACFTDFSLPLTRAHEQIRNLLKKKF